MIFVVCGAAHIEFSLSDVSGEGRGPVGGVGRGDGGGRGDSDLKVKSLERKPGLGVNLKPESSARSAAFPGNNTFLIEPAGPDPNER